MIEKAKEIIRALEHCSSGRVVDCSICPHHNLNDFCYIERDSLEVIKSLIEENESLHGACTELTRKLYRVEDINKKLQEQKSKLEVVLRQAQYKLDMLIRINDNLNKEVDGLKELIK